MKSLSQSLFGLPCAPLAYSVAPGALRRKGLIRPPSSSTFVRPLRQSFVKDARLAPGTTRMLCLLAGWGGDGEAICTTLGVIAKHLQRSPRQIQRYPRDAAEEGYLFWCKTANRLGYVTGLKIWINASALFAPDRKRPKREKASEDRRKLATTDVSDTKTSLYINRTNPDAFDRKLREICDRNGVPYVLE